MDMRDWEYRGGDYVNVKTGEVIEFSDSSVEVVSEEVADGIFARLYLDSVGSGFSPEDLSPSAQRLFWYLVKNMKYVRSKEYAIKFGPESKVDMMEALGMGMRTFRSAYYQLRDLHYIIFLAHNKIQINPKFVARGNSSDIVAMKQSIVKATSGKYYRITEMGVAKKGSE